MKLWNGLREKRDFKSAMGFLMPNLLGFLIFTSGPVLLSLYMSFTNWSLKPAVELEWVGLRNYMDLLADGDFWFYLYNTFYFMFGIPFAVCGSLFLANLLVDQMRIKVNRTRHTLAFITLIVGILTSGFMAVMGWYDAALLVGIVFLAAFFGVLFGSMTYRTMFYVPSFASGVATIVLWMQIYNPEAGLANNLIELILPAGVEAPHWLTSSKNLLGFIPQPAHFNSGGFGLGAREAIMFMGFWMGIGGNNMILYIASISNIPDSLYEAAEIDGAGSFSKFWHITVPSVAPTTFFIAIMATIAGLQGGFQFAKIMTEGGPAGMTTTLAYYIYVAGFEELKLGYASAVAWVMFVIIFALTLFNWKYGNKRMESAT
jgi:multiple sugar transport system permease protein